jgi:opacity protein-like surface antigen
MILNKIKQALLICSILQIGSAFFCSSASAQESVTTSELGIGIGGANYKGEVAPKYRFLNNQPAATVFYRRDISAPLTLRGGLMGSHRIWDENTFSDEAYDLPLPNYRQADVRISMLEASVVAEYNFLDYYDMSQKPRVSPYFFAGVAGLLYHVKTTIGEASLGDAYNGTVNGWDLQTAFAIPFGVGVKYALSKHWNLGAEFGARKTFTDRLDKLDEKNINNNGEPDKRVINPYDNDWYFYNGISISYTIYRYNCPPPYRRKRGLLE